MLMFLIRSPIVRLGIGWMFAQMSFALPVNRLKEKKTLIAFHHAQPSYPVHILLVPKKAIADLSDLESDDGDFLGDFFATVQNLVSELVLDDVGYRLIVNGGPYQEVPQLHFHLVSG